MVAPSYTPDRAFLEFGLSHIVASRSVLNSEGVAFQCIKTERAREREQSSSFEPCHNGNFDLLREREGICALFIK